MNFQISRDQILPHILCSLNTRAGKTRFQKCSVLCKASVVCHRSLEATQLHSLALQILSTSNFLSGRQINSLISGFFFFFFDIYVQEPTVWLCCY